jgi:hypothetical protein
MNGSTLSGLYRYIYFNERCLIAPIRLRSAGSLQPLCRLTPRTFCGQDLYAPPFRRSRVRLKGRRVER